MSSEQFLQGLYLVLCCVCYVIFGCVANVEHIV